MMHATGNGSTSHLDKETFKPVAKIDIVHVAYKDSFATEHGLAANKVSKILDAVTTARTLLLANQNRQQCGSNVGLRCAISVAASSR